MEIFYLINGFAGHYPTLDALMRFVYVAAVPLLATTLAAWILLVPISWKSPKAASSGALLTASVLTILLGVLTMGIINAFEHFVLGGEVLSRRPFLTHYVTSLVMQPNNNSFPSFEVMYAASLATLLWAARPRVGFLGWLLAGTLGISHLYCGTNFTLDVVIGAIWGTALAGITLAICKISLTFPITGGKHLRWRPTFQGAASLIVMTSTVIYVTGWIAKTPNHLPPLFALLHNSKTAEAAPIIVSKTTFDTETSSNITAQKTREMLLLTDAVKQDGYLPLAEKYLLDELQKQRTGMKVLGVNVAELKSGKTPYRCAVIRFQVVGQGNAARKRVIAVAARLLKAAFHADASIDHIDILGIKDDPKSNLLYTKGGTPIFSASIEKSSLILQGKNAWLNSSSTDPGLWLRARSLLYFDSHILPSTETFPAKGFLIK